MLTTIVKKLARRSRAGSGARTLITHPAWLSRGSHSRHREFSSDSSSFGGLRPAAEFRNGRDRIPTTAPPRGNMEHEIPTATSQAANRNGRYIYMREAGHAAKSFGRVKQSQARRLSHGFLAFLLSVGGGHSRQSPSGAKLWFPRTGPNHVSIGSVRKGKPGKQQAPSPWN